LTSGLDWDEGSESIEENDVYKMGLSEDFLKYALDKAPIHEPGAVWNYSSGDSMILSGAIQAATGQTTHEFARAHLLGRLGITNFEWESDPTGATVGGWGITTPAREYAKLGYLYLKNGWWDGTVVVPSWWIDDSTSPASSRIDFYGYLWWLASSLSGYNPSLVPPDTFIALGLFTQQIFVMPSRDLVVVRLGDDIDPNPGDWDEVTFLGLILNSFL
jgi:CubicO group peptidase (beta-lactamase class C family)